MIARVEIFFMSISPVELNASRITGAVCSHTLCSGMRSEFDLRQSRRLRAKTPINSAPDSRECMRDLSEAHAGDDLFRRQSDSVAIGNRLVKCSSTIALSAAAKKHHTEMNHRV